MMNGMDMIWMGLMILSEMNVGVFWWWLEWLFEELEFGLMNIFWGIDKWSNCKDNGSNKKGRNR